MSANILMWFTGQIGSEINRNFYKELIQKAGAETELVYMKASKELLQKRLYKRNQVLNANSPFVITDEILEHCQSHKN